MQAGGSGVDEGKMLLAGATASRLFADAAADTSADKEAELTRERLSYIFRVYGALSVQNAVVLLVSALFVFVPPIKAVITDNVWLPIAFAILFVGIVVPLALMRDHEGLQGPPWSVVALVLFMTSEALLVGAVSAIFGTWTLIMIMGFNSAILGTSTIYACQSRYNFTPIVGILITALCLLLVAGAVTSVLGITFGGLIWAAIVSIIYCIVVIVHTHLTMGRIVSDGGNKPEALAKKDGWAQALRVNVDVLAVFPFLYGVIVACCPGLCGKAADKDKSKDDAKRDE